MLEIKNFDSIKFMYKNKKIEFKEIEKYIFYLINKINYSNNKKNILIGIELDETFILAIIYYIINEYVENACNQENNILNDIKEGDKLVLNNKDIIVFQGIEVFNEKEYIVGKDTKNYTRKLPVEGNYELTKYVGTATRINKNKYDKSYSNIVKDLLSDILDIDKDKFIGDIINSTVIVVESKEKLYSMIYDLSVEYKGIKYSISEVFPIAYYSSEERFEFFKGNRIKQNAIIKFTINSSTALDIIQDDENIKNVIFIGNNTYKNSLETEIRQIDLYDNIEKILLIDTWESSFDFSLIDDEFKVYALTKDVIYNNIKLNNNFEKIYKNEIQQKNYNLICNLIDKEVNIYDVEMSDQINENIHEITKCLKSLFDICYENREILDFLRLGYSLCNRIERTILPLNQSEKNNYEINETITKLRGYLKLFEDIRSEYIIMNEIIIRFTNIIESMKYKNPKSEFLKRKFNDKKRYILALKNKEEFYDVCSYFAKYPSCKFIPKIINKRNKLSNEENVIIPFYISDDETNIILTNTIFKVNIIIYEREKNKINVLVRKTEKIIKYIENINAIGNLSYDSLENYFNIKYIYCNKEICDNKCSELEELINTEFQVQEAISENLLNICIRKSLNGVISQGNSINVKKFITFKDGKYCFLSNFYKANILEDNNILIKEIDKLNINDKIVFSLNKIDGEEDIVKIVLKKLLENKTFNEVHGKYFTLNKLWKTELKNYMNKYCLSEEDICSEFRVRGITKHKLTISNWLNGNIIGPKNGDDIRTVAEIINSKELNNNLEEVILACSYERRIQIKVRKALAELIIDSVISTDNEENEIRKLIKDTIDDIDKYSYIGEIESIKNIDEEMNQQYVNKIIERV